MSRTIKALTATLTAALLCPMLIGWDCDLKGSPSVDSFGLRYDAICDRDMAQSVSWEATPGSTVTISVLSENGTVQQSKSVPESSNGWHPVDISALTAGKYTIQVKAKNKKGEDKREREFVIVSERGEWISIQVFADRPEEGPWYGISETVPVLVGQGLQDEDNVISISENVTFRHIRWRSRTGDWPTATSDPMDCTPAVAEQLKTMQISQGLTSNTTMKENREYDFPADFSAKGTYTCTVDWRWCNWGVQGAAITDKSVSFYLELEAICN